MESLYLLIPLSIVLAFAIGIAFWWFVKSGQFDDLEGPAYRILMDDDNAVNQEEANSPQEQVPEQTSQPQSDICYDTRDNTHLPTHNSNDDTRHSTTAGDN